MEDGKTLELVSKLFIPVKLLLLWFSDQGT